MTWLGIKEQVQNIRWNGRSHFTISTIWDTSKLPTDFQYDPVVRMDHWHFQGPVHRLQFTLSSSLKSVSWNEANVDTVSAFPETSNVSSKSSEYVGQELSSKLPGNLLMETLLETCCIYLKKFPYLDLL